MAREIKFRGKDIETDKWVDGDLIQRMGYMPSVMFPYESNGKVRYGECAVKRETVGQFTGLFDKNGKEIYEGDIIKTKRYGVVHGQLNTQGADLFRVVYKNAQFYIDNKLRHFYLQDSRCNEVIGNVFDNPELLEGGAE